MQGVRYYHHLLEQYQMGLMAARRGYQAKAHSGLSDLLASHQDRVFRNTSQMLFGKNSSERTERWCTFVLRQLDHPECQRILFDSAQASLFTELGAAPEAEMLRLVHPPFARTYIEFTHPIACASNEPGYREELQALFVRELTHLERMEMMTTTPVLGAMGSGSTGPSPQLPLSCAAGILPRRTEHQ